jgi:NADH:ubiquinone oxidoreductase subunit 2 (subunit N)
MNVPTSTAAVAANLALALGGALLALSASLAARPATRGSHFGWGVISGLACAILGLAAAIRAADSGGLLAALLHLVTVVLAGALAALSLPPRSPEPTGNTTLGAVGRGLAWLALVGLPPTLGFHAKVTLYRALLIAGWGWMAALAMAISAVLLLPALREIRSFRAGALSGPRAVSVMALIALTVVLGCYPYLWLVVNAIAGRIAGSG